MCSKNKGITDYLCTSCDVWPTCGGFCIPCVEVSLGCRSSSQGRVPVTNVYLTVSLTGRSRTTSCGLPGGGGYRNPLRTQPRISALRKKRELKAVSEAVKDRREQLKKNVVPARNLTEAEKVALAEGNSEEMIRVNKEKYYDYSGVKKADLHKALLWFRPGLRTAACLGASPQEEKSSRSSNSRARVPSLSFKSRFKLTTRNP